MLEGRMAGQQLIERVKHFEVSHELVLEHLDDVSLRRLLVNLVHELPSHGRASKGLVGSQLEQHFLLFLFGCPERGSVVAQLLHECSSLVSL